MVDYITPFDYKAVMKQIYDKGPHAINQDMLNLFQVFSERCFRPVPQNIVDFMLSNSKLRRTYEEKRLISLLPLQNWTRLDQSMNHNWSKLEDTFTKCQGILKQGSWKCEEGFSRAWTRHGLCYTFNSLDRSYLLRDDT